MIHFTLAWIMVVRKSNEKQAWDILENLKTQVIEILWNDDLQCYNNDHQLIPWIQEEAEYAIKRLNLSAERESYFIRKIELIIGEYMEET